jgi:hypothetical protein
MSGLTTEGTENTEVLFVCKHFCPVSKSTTMGWRQVPILNSRCLTCGKILIWEEVIISEEGGE